MISNAQLAHRVLDGLCRAGVREFCIAAGARNAPLLGPLLASPELSVFHFFDERSAAFFALGRCMAKRRPVVVITTSGTAAAELLPATVEAFYQGLPLVLVTADRPKNYRGTGAPQAIDQVGLFGNYAMPTIDLDAASPDFKWPAGPLNLPVHINVCFEEPTDEPIETLSVSEEALSISESGGEDERAKAILESWSEKSDGLVVLAGGISPDRVGKVAEFLRAMNAPVLAEATANLEGRPELEGLLLRGGEKSLRDLSVRKVIHIGAVPSWRWWRDLEDRPEIAVLNIGEVKFPGLARRENVESADWSALNLKVDHCVGALKNVGGSDLPDRLTRVLEEYDLSEVAWMRALSGVVPTGSCVLLGNSLTIREWNLAALPPKEGTVFFANRGANGIDGQVSTFLGLGADASESWLICGDLTALYDLSAPWVLNQLQAGNRRIVVINNNGGRIFSRMNAFRALSEEGRERVESRHELSFEPWAKMWGLDYRVCLEPSDLENLPMGAVLIEVLPDEVHSQGFWSAWSA